MLITKSLILLLLFLLFLLLLSRQEKTYKIT